MKLIHEPCKEEIGIENLEFSFAFMKSFYNPTNCIIALIDEQRVGYLGYSIYKPNLNIYGIIVLEQYQRRGIGTSLIKEAENIGKKERLDYILLIHSSDLVNRHVHSGYKSNYLDCSLVKRLI